MPKDLKALCMIAHDNYLECPVLENIIRSNELHVKKILDKIISLADTSIGFLGLSFKPGTDDLRNSPIVDIIENLIGKGYDVKIYDKNVSLSRLLGANKEYINRKIPYISNFIVEDPKILIEHSNLIVVVNKENKYEELLNKFIKNQIIFDITNIEFDDKNTKKYIGLSW